MEKEKVLHTELLIEDSTLYVLHKRDKIECNKFYAGVQPDYGGGITKEDAIEFAKEIQHRFNNFYPMLEALKMALSTLETIDFSALEGVYDKIPFAQIETAIKAAEQ